MRDVILFFFSSRRRHTRYWRDWSSDVCSSDLGELPLRGGRGGAGGGHIKESNRALRGSPCSPRSARERPVSQGIGRAAGRGRVEISGGAGSFKKKKRQLQATTTY